jgi:RimJ/RimL family protein N-acetyltransferase
MVRSFWPLFDLEVRTPLLTLRYVDDTVAADLASLVSEPIHDPADMPFSEPWTDAPEPERQRNAYRFWARCRAGTTVDEWMINFAVIHDGRAIGACGLTASSFPTLRSFETGSWIVRREQGRGLGTEMRAGLLHLGFAGFDAREATTAAFADNARSLGVTRRLGYEPNGSATTVRRGAPAELLRFRLRRERWEPGRRADIEIDGLDATRALLGIA